MNRIDQLQKQITALDDMNLDSLHDFYRIHWQSLKHCRSKTLLRKKISFMLQSESLGNLPESIKKQVYDIGLGEPRIKNSKGIMTGTTFTRKWKGETYRLVAVVDGFVMDGQKFKSLSGAAMAVTGTQWSGKVFWKVK